MAKGRQGDAVSPPRSLAVLSKCRYTTESPPEAFCPMALLSSFNEDRPISYIRGYPIYCATLLTVAYGVGILLSAILFIEFRHSASPRRFRCACIKLQLQYSTFIIHSFIFERCVTNIFNFFSSLVFFSSFTCVFQVNCFFLFSS